MASITASLASPNSSNDEIMGNIIRIRSDGCLEYQLVQCLIKQLYGAYIYIHILANHLDGTLEEVIDVFTLYVSLLCNPCAKDITY
jgi:hypothetical protein